MRKLVDPVPGAELSELKGTETDDLPTVLHIRNVSFLCTRIYSQGRTTFSPWGDNKVNLCLSRLSLTSLHL